MRVCFCVAPVGGSLALGPFCLCAVASLRPADSRGVGHWSLSFSPCGCVSGSVSSRVCVCVLYLACLFFDRGVCIISS